MRCCRIPTNCERIRETDDPALIANLVEELMRYLSIVHSQVDRVAVEDLTINGQLIRAGDHVLMNLPAGNWDDAFVDDPETLDVDRSARGHLGFGFGVHQCIGQNLARVELQIALTTLVPPPARTPAGGSTGGAELRRRAGDLHDPRAAGHLVTQLSA